MAGLGDGGGGGGGELRRGEGRGGRVLVLTKKGGAGEALYQRGKGMLTTKKGISMEDGTLRFALEMMRGRWWRKHRWASTWRSWKPSREGGGEEEGGPRKITS